MAELMTSVQLAFSSSCILDVLAGYLKNDSGRTCRDFLMVILDIY